MLKKSNIEPKKQQEIQFIEDQPRLGWNRPVKTNE
jgi:hypothetical protein